MNAAGLNETKQRIEEQYKDVAVHIAICDISNEDSVEELINGTVKKYGRLDYCANVAGITVLGVRTHEMETKFFEKNYEVNLKGLFFCERAQLRTMLKQEPLKSRLDNSPHQYYQEPYLRRDSKLPSRGSIVNVSSMAGLVGTKELPAYAATKHGVNGISKAVLISP